MVGRTIHRTQVLQLLPPQHVANSDLVHGLWGHAFGHQRQDAPQNLMSLAGSPGRDCFVIPKTFPLVQRIAGI
jgi:hypothetical protein